MPQGESRFEYSPGKPRPTLPPIDETDYQLNLLDMGKHGPAGWKQKSTAKFPCRHLRFAILGTEDPISGQERTVMFYLSTQPQAIQSLYDIAEAAGYTGEVSFNLPRKPGDSAVREAATAADEVLNWIKDNGVILNAHLTNEEYRGRPQVRIDHFLNASSAPTQPPGEVAEQEEVEAEEVEAEEEVEATRRNGAPRRTAPPPKHRAPLPKRTTARAGKGRR